VPAVVLSIIASVVACSFVGLRLLSLTTKTRKLPELCMGVGLFAFALAQASRLAFGGFGARLGPELALGVYVSMQLGYLVAQTGLCLFAVGVFGPHTRWRWVLFAGIVAVVAVSRAMMVVESAPRLLSGLPNQMIPLWEPAAVASFALGFGWMAVESLRYHGLLRRRLALGLSDPLVANRFLVWGAGAAATCVMVSILLGLYLNGMTAMTNSLMASVVITSSGLLFAVVPCLTFAPPAAYLRLVERRAERREIGPV
jgi:hypothetical protein